MESKLLSVELNVKIPNTTVKYKIRVTGKS